MNEKDFLIDNLSLLLSSGVDVITALESIKTEVHSKKLKKSINLIQEHLKSGSTLWQALASSKLWPDYAISLVKMGEESGNLTENLKFVALEQQKERSYRSKITSAMIYPVFVFSITIIVGLAVALFLLPKLAITFSQLKIELPLITKILIAAGLFLGKFGIIFVPSLIILLLSCIYVLFFHQKTKFLGEIILWQISPVKILIQQVEIARLGYLLGTLLTSGITVVESLSSLAQSSTSKLYQKLYLHLHQKIAEGNSFSNSLSLYKGINSLIPAPIVQMIVASEQSGQLPQTLSKIGQMYEEKGEITTKNLTVLLEPILLIIVWLAVLAVALAIIVPIYSLIGGLNR